jgi:hypothetical protein
MAETLAVKNGGCGGFNASYGYASPNETEYTYQSGLNTWKFPKPAGKSLYILQILVFNNATRESGMAYEFYWTSFANSTRYLYFNTNGSPSRTAIAYPATSSHRIGFQDNGNEIIVSFYETGSSVTNLNADIFLYFQ